MSDNAGLAIYFVYLAGGRILSALCADAQSPRQVTPPEACLWYHLNSHFPSWNLIQSINIMKAENNKFTNVMPINPHK